MKTQSGTITSTLSSGRILPFASMKLAVTFSRSPDENGFYERHPLDSLDFNMKQTPAALQLLIEEQIIKFSEDQFGTEENGLTFASFCLRRN